MSQNKGIGPIGWVLLTGALAACSGKDVQLGGKNPLAGSGGSAAGAGTDGGPGGGASGGSGGSGTDGGPGGPGGSGNGGADTDGGGGTPVPNKTGIKTTNKLDLLIVVDNSISMADKQQALKVTVPDLVNRLTATGSGVDDLHVGVITSSLGDHGDNDTCLGNDADPIGEQQDDHAHLVTTRPRGLQLGLPAVLSWDRTGDANTLSQQIQSVVVAAGEFGCGLESQLEAMYRFLADPFPPQTIAKVQCPNAPQGTMCAAPTGLDTELIAERAKFLRPDSAVAVVLLTDENDCSIRDTQQFFYATRTDIVLPNGTSVCATNPNDPCCFSCASHGPANCGDPKADPNCQGAPNTDKDPINLRCFHEKQRFGLDFLYPVQRYMNALSKTTLCTSNVSLTPMTNCVDANADGKPDLVDNPLFVSSDGTVRDPSMVYMLGIVGVPWQDVATSTTGPLVYKSPSALTSSGTWNVIMGNPSASPPVLPTDGLMVESTQPRNGNDASGTPIPGPGATLAQNNAINGHDWANGGGDDLMYACIFKLPQSRNCSVVEQQKPAPGCDCGSAQAPGDNNPLCQDPTAGTYSDNQFYAKAYPGERELAVLNGLGSQGLAASVCARNLTDSTAADYGYRPAIESLVSGLKRSTP